MDAIFTNCECLKLGVVSTGRQTEKNVSSISITETNNNSYDQIKTDTPFFILSHGTQSHPFPH